MSGENIKERRASEIDLMRYAVKRYATDFLDDALCFGESVRSNSEYEASKLLIPHIVSSIAGFILLPSHKTLDLARQYDELSHEFTAYEKDHYGSFYDYFMKTRADNQAITMPEDKANREAVKKLKLAMVARRVREELRQRGQLRKNQFQVSGLNISYVFAHSAVLKLAEGSYKDT
jgi:hypothetical protein